MADGEKDDSAENDSDACDEEDFVAELNSPLPTKTYTKRDRRVSMVDENVRDAWMTRGWTLSTNIKRNGKSFAVTEPMKSGPTCRQLSQEVNAGQARLASLSEVNQMLRSTLVKRKVKIRDLRAKIDSLVKSLAAACGVEQEGRQQLLDDVEVAILDEEKRKQEMMLELNQRIQAAEDASTAISTANNSLDVTNAWNKKLLKEQQAEIKERTKATRHLERQILVLIGARQKMSSQAAGVIPDEGAPSKSDMLADDFDADDLQRPGLSDSKSLLRGAQAERHLKEQQQHLEEQKLLSKATLTSPGRTANDLKSLPGLNLALLLGMDEDASKSKQSPTYRAKPDALPEISMM